MSLYITNKTQKIKKLKSIFKLENISSCIWNEKLFDYLLVNENDTNKYLCGNIYTILSYIGEFLGNLYTFKCDRNNLIEFVLECYDILIGDIVIDGINVIDTNKYYKQLIGDNTTTKTINVKNVEIDFRHIKIETIRKKFNDSDKFIAYLTNKLKLQTIYIRVNDVMFNKITKENREIKDLKNCLYKRKQYKVSNGLVNDYNKLQTLKSQ